MYTALLIMFVGIAAGRALAGKIGAVVLRRAVMCSIFLLLFLLGANIGANRELLADLPRLGWQALVLMLFCVGGSIFCAWLASPLYFWLAKKKTTRRNVE